ncbi:uncharacterized protein LOC143203413 [Rhynchophorus ferrugineus]|uniref:uncharacterized protein LOC143203413 n=1 Tax=Rhynchophorus ferrugineus TaxID=354439 RepID=UPI003FCEE513
MPSTQNPWYRFAVFVISWCSHSNESKILISYLSCIYYDHNKCLLSTGYIVEPLRAIIKKSSSNDCKPSATHRHSPRQKKHSVPCRCPPYRTEPAPIELSLAPNSFPVMPTAVAFFFSSVALQLQVFISERPPTGPLRAARTGRDGVL